MDGISRRYSDRQWKEALDRKMDVVGKGDLDSTVTLTHAGLERVSVIALVYICTHRRVHIYTHDILTPGVQVGAQQHASSDVFSTFFFAVSGQTAWFSGEVLAAFWLLLLSQEDEPPWQTPRAAEQGDWGPPFDATRGRTANKGYGATLRRQVQSAWHGFCFVRTRACELSSQMLLICW